MRSIDDEMCAFRESVRSIWNLALRTSERGESCIDEIEQLLLDTIVLNELSNLEGVFPSDPKRRISQIVVEVVSSTVMVGTMAGNVREWDFESSKPYQGRSDVRFLGLFDLGPLGASPQMRDFEYAELGIGGVPADPSKPRIVARFCDCRFFDATSQ